MKRATAQALSVPTFRTPKDCTPQVLGGLWPAELQRVTAETASVAEYLDRDLRRIASSANEKLRAISEADLSPEAREAEEARVINVARAFAVLRAESTIRQLRREPLGFSPEYLSLGPAADPPTQIVARTEEPARVAPRPDPAPRHAAWPRDEVDEPSATAVEPPAADVAVPDEPDLQLEPDAEVVEEHEPEIITPDASRPTGRPEPVLIESVNEVVVPAPPRESDEHRLRRFLLYVARQEPGLKWAVGQRADGTTVLVTDLAHGWIPSGIALPAGVTLLEPARRQGGAAALLGATVLSTTYTPGDPFGDASQFEATARSNAARRTEPVDDLGWQLTEATHWRDGLPRMAHTMAKAGAAGTGVVEAELDVLRVHLDTVRYQLLARYPDVEPGVLLNCLLLAATEAIASGDQTAANYHFAWYRAASAPLPSNWGAQGRPRCC
ncbi:hypothetical protein BH09ACT8_BH09ACT8_05790 [soil metagenome]